MHPVCGGRSHGQREVQLGGRSLRDEDWHGLDSVGRSPQTCTPKSDPDQTDITIVTTTMTLHDDRRRAPRHEVQWPCKIWHLRARKYYPGWTGNCSTTGVLLTLDRPLDLEPGEALRVDVRHDDHPGLGLHRDMTSAIVVRSLKTPGGRTQVAVHLDHPVEQIGPRINRRNAA